MTERLKQIRKALDMTQQEFADKLGTTRDNIGGYETGRRNPSAAVVSLICREFNVNEEWLRNGEGEMFVEVPRDEQIASFIGGILKSEDDSFKKRFIAMLKALDESDWEVLEKMSLLLTQGKEE